jgi:hypothetical protein
MRARSARILLFALLAVALIAACGGGSGSGRSAARNEGIWVGANSNGMSGAMVILAQGELWSLVTRSFDAANVAAVVPARSYYGSIGFRSQQPLRLQAADDNATFAGTGNYLSYDDGADFRGLGAVSGTIASENAVSVRLADGSTFSGKFQRMQDTSVSVASFAGTYVGRVHVGSDIPATFPATLTVTQEGVIRQDAGNCTFSGRIHPLAAGRQVHDAEIVPVGICLDPQRSQGVAVLDTEVSPPRLYILSTHDSKVGGYAYVGIRQ